MSLPQMRRLLEIMVRLRDPESGCPWDIEQTFETIAPYTIEEAYEVADAIEQGDMTSLRDELGDLLLQVVYHTRMAEEDGLFTFEDVAAGIADKMVRRHPHVFGDQDISSAEAQTRNWEEQKAAERREKAAGNDRPASALDGVARTLPGLIRAEKLTKRAARVGFDWPEVDQVFNQLDEETAELKAEIEAQKIDPDRLEDELGDMLFVMANLARKLKLDPEQAIRRANAKFERRFRRVEELLVADGREAETSTLEEMDEKWREAKREERAAPSPMRRAG
ncbi:MAG: nucleoside triphosphate pyrophosphohydrolase [Rhodospirillales bacterium]